MLSTIRHFQRGIMIAVAVIVVIAFTFIDSPGDPSRMSDKNVINVNGEAISAKEAGRLQTTYMVMVQLGIYDFASFLFGPERMNADLTDFAVNFTLFRQEAKRLGVVPSPEVVAETASTLPVVQYAGLDQDAIESRILNPSGFTSADFYELMSDYAAYKQIRSLVNAGIEPLESEIEERYLDRYVTIHGSVITFDRAPFAEEAEKAITDEQIAEHHAANGAQYESKTMRAVDLIRFKQDELPEDATNEAIANAKLDYTRMVDEVTSQFENDGSNFDAVVADNQLEVESFDPFPADEAPEGLAEDSEIAETVFSQAISELRPVSAPLRLMDGSYFVLRLREHLEPAPLDLEAATPLIREQLVDEKTAALMEAAVAEARAKITEALDAGQSIAEAAKAAGLEATPLPPFTPDSPPAGEVVQAPGAVAAVAAGLNPGELSQTTIPGEETADLVYVEKKELVDSPDEAMRMSGVRGSAISDQSNLLMRGWFRERLDEADIWTHVRIVNPEETGGDGEESGDGEAEEDTAEV